MKAGRRWSEDYVAHVLRPAFLQEKRYLFKPLMLVSRAHAVMLARVGLLAPADAGRLMRALREVEDGGVRGYTHREDFEDLYFAVEQKLVALAGVTAGGNLQIARSRHEVDAAMTRIVLRETVLGLYEALSELRSVLVERALEHPDALMPGYARTQPAQPTTLGHYLAAAVGCLERDARRLGAAYATTNRNPLGAVALTTTGFGIRRELTEALLGFEGLVENSIDAVGAADHALEAAAAAMTLGANLSRFSFDLLTWSSRDHGFLSVTVASVKGSSAMSNQHSPSVLGRVRAKLARAHGAGGTVFGMTRDLPYGDVLEAEDALVEPLLACFNEIDEAVGLLAALLEEAVFDTERMAELSGEHFTTAAGLADALVEEAALPFRVAQGVVSRVVEIAYERGMRPAEVGSALVDEVAQERLGRPVGLSDPRVRRALDPRAFVDARRLPGGPARQALLPFLGQARVALAADESWRRNELARLRRARERLDEAADSLADAAGVG